MEKLRNLSKSKIMLVIILLTGIINVDLLPVLFAIMSGIALIKSIKNKKKFKIAVFGICLFFTGFLSLAVHLPNRVYEDTTEAENTTSIVSKEEVDQEVANISEETIVTDETDTDEDQEVNVEHEINIDETELYLNNVDQIVSSVINSEISYNFKNTTLNRVTINENMGTDYDKDVVVLAYLSWSTKNLEKTTREMLEMYSNHLAAKLAPNLEDGSEIALFWDAEYTGLSIKHSYYIKNGNAYVQ